MNKDRKVLKTLNLDLSLLEKIEQMAYDERMSQAEIIREALSEYFDKRGR